jgi:carbamoyltransferase
MKGSYLGPRYENDQISDFLKDVEGISHIYNNEDDLLKEVCSAIKNEKIIGWFNGRMEFGPRALGNRSIIGDARSEKTQTQMNLSIKYRESFRPFAPSVLEEKSQEYFDLDSSSPYMLLVAPIEQSIRSSLTPKDEDTMKEPNLLKRVRIKRSTIPAVTHVDYSARVQTVSEPRNGRYYRLIKKFEQLTGSGVIVNTSFNVRGEPIVSSPEDAYRCFMATEMDVLVIENHILYKTEQPPKNIISKDSHVSQFKLD